MAHFDDVFDEKFAKQESRAKDIEIECKLRTDFDFALEDTGISEAIEDVVSKLNALGWDYDRDKILEMLKES